MTFFDSTEEIKRAIGGLVERCSTNGEVGPKIKRYNSTIKFIFHNPEYSFIIDCKGPKASSSEYYIVREVDAKDAEKVDIELEMDGDIGHRLFLGNITFPKAILTNTIKYKGNIRLLIKLGEVLTTIQRLYPRHLEKINKIKSP